VISKFLLFSLLIYCSLIIGHTARKRWITRDISASLMKTSIMFIEPIIICLTFWALEISSPRLLTLPLVATLLSISILIPARVFSGFHKHASEDRGAYLGGSMFSNVGMTLGGFVCFLFLGETGLGLSIIYAAYFIPFFFSIGFYIARRYSSASNPSWRENLRNFFTDPISLTPNIAIIFGLLLNFSGKPRPEALSSVNKFLVPLTVVIYSFAIGLTMRFRMIRDYLPECFTMSLIKFLISPVLGLGLAYLLGCSQFMDGLPLKVVFIEATMPAAIFSLVLSRLFNLNQDLANSCWIFTTLAVILILPLIYIIINAL